MTWSNVPYYLLAGLAAGTLNVAAAAGAPISFLVLYGLGLPVDVANSTNLTAMPASFLGGLRRAWIGRRTYRKHWPVVAVAVAGCLVGVAVVTVFGSAWLQAGAPYLLMVAAVLIVVQPAVVRLQRPRAVALAGVGGGAGAAVSPAASGRPAERLVAVGVPMFFAGTYAGMFGGGVGALVVGVLLLAGRWTIQASNDAKIVICLATSVVGAAAFGVTGHVAWGPCLVVAAGMVAGGYVGGQLLTYLEERAEAGKRQAAERWLRGLVAVASAGAAVWMLTR